MNLLVFCIFLFFSASSQTQTPITLESGNAIGLRFFNTQDFGLMYKKQIAPQTYRRYTLAFLRSDFSHESSFSRYQFSTGLNVGKEKHKSISKSFDFYHGPEYGFSTGFNGSSESFDAFQLSLNWGYIIGTEYKIKNTYSISLELTPRLGASYRYQPRDPDQLSVYSNFNMSSVAINFQFYFNAVKNSNT